MEKSFHDSQSTRAIPTDPLHKVKNQSPPEKSKDFSEGDRREGIYQLTEKIKLGASYNSIQMKKQRETSRQTPCIRVKQSPLK